MLPLLFLSIVSLTLIAERIWFWAALHRPARIRWLQRLGRALRSGERDAAKRLVDRDRSPYGQVGRHLLDYGAGDAVAVEAVELQRPKFDRFMVSLSTVWSSVRIGAVLVIGAGAAAVAMVTVAAVVKAKAMRSD